MRRPFRKPSHAPYEFDELAAYNSRRAKGIAHTPEYEARMAREQARFAAKQQADLEAEGFVVDPANGYAIRPPKGEINMPAPAQ